MKSSNIGGQAVLEGIMMRHGDDYAVAVRKPDGEIFVQKEEYHSVIKWKALTKIPFIRGVFNFIDSMVLGIKTLMFSAEFYEDEEEVKRRKRTDRGRNRKEGKTGKTDDECDSCNICSNCSSSIYGSAVFSVFIIKTTDAIVSFENISGRICEDWYIYSLYCIDFKNG